MPIRVKTSDDRLHGISSSRSNPPKSFQKANPHLLIILNSLVLSHSHFSQIALITLKKSEEISFRCNWKWKFSIKATWLRAIGRDANRLMLPIDFREAPRTFQSGVHKLWITRLEKVAEYAFRQEIYSGFSKANQVLNFEGPYNLMITWWSSEKPKSFTYISLV